MCLRNHFLFIVCRYNTFAPCLRCASADCIGGTAPGLRERSSRSTERPVKARIIAPSIFPNEFFIALEQFGQKPSGGSLWSRRTGSCKSTYYERWPNLQAPTA